VRYHVPICSVREPTVKYSPYAPDKSSVISRDSLGVRLMRSERWFPGTSKKAFRGIPYVDNAGHITGSVILNWRCSSAQWFSTVVRSVWKSLSKRNRNKSRKNKMSKDLLTRISIFYSISMDDSKLERLLHCDVGRARALLQFYTCNLDDQQRFLYGQMSLSGILWLQSRGKPRAQSIKKTYIPSYRNFGLRSYDTTRDVNAYLNWASDPWIVGPLRLSCGSDSGVYPQSFTYV